jgi:hypothetical protein
MIQPEIQIYRLRALRAALKLEIAGMKRRGPSVYSIIKKEFNLTGNKQTVLEKFSALIEERDKERVDTFPNYTV